MAEPEPDADVRALRALYARLEPTPPAEALEGCDAETVRAVEWMRAAWGTLEPRSDLVLRPLPRRRGMRPIARSVWTAAAAVLLVAGPAWILWRLVRPADLDDVGPGAGPHASTGIELVAASDQRLELRSGPVRLVLLAALPDTSQ